MSEVQELVVIDQENMKHLSLGTQQLIKELSEELDIKKLTVFNPLVERMIAIEQYKEFKYIPEDKESIANYKSAWKDIRNFRSVTKKTKSLLKKPILETGKKLDTIERIFVDRATDVLDGLEEEYKGYLEEQERIKEEKEAKKNKATTDKIAELSEEATQSKIIIERMNAYNSITKELNNMITEAVAQSTTYSKEALEKELSDLNAYTDFTFDETEAELLLDEQKEEILELFTKNKTNAIGILQNAIKLANVPPPVTPEVQAPVPNVDDIPQTPGPVMMAPSLTQANPDYFKDSCCDILTDALEAIENLQPANEKETSVQKGTIEGLNKIQNKIIDYLT